MDTIEIESTGRPAGHPWVELSRLREVPDSMPDGQSLSLVLSDGTCLGSGVFDRRFPRAAWRRHSHAEGVFFDEAYIASALVEAIERRAEESCQRLVSSDADYLPGIVVEIYGDVVWVCLETAAARAQSDVVAEVIREIVNPVEIVVSAGGVPVTLSGQGLKGRWVDLDELLFRIDLLDTTKPRVFLDQREQHALFGSLCEGRSLLDLFSHSGGFAMQALRAGAEHAVAVDSEDSYVKAIGANAQRNELRVDALTADALGYLGEVDARAFDALVIDPPAGYYLEAQRLNELHEQAFRKLPQAALLATYCRDVSLADFDSLVAKAAADVGREARIFARTSQPFDYPMLLNFPESQVVRGLILQVE